LSTFSAQQVSIVASNRQSVLDQVGAMNVPDGWCVGFRSKARTTAAWGADGSVRAEQEGT